MAIYHCTIGNVSRGAGSSSCGSYAYISGEKVYDERRQETFDYSRKERILETGTINPDYAPEEYKDAKKLFNAIEKHETADNARTAKKIEVALPKELDLQEQKKIVEDFIRNNLTKAGYCATYAIHADEKGTGNDHAHILVPNRPLNQKGEWSNKRKTVFVLDERGERVPALEYQKDDKGKFIKDENGNKIPVLDKDGNTIQKVDGKGTPQWVRTNEEVNPLDTKKFLCDLRREWATEVNKHLEPELQIDHRSHKDRGLDIEPTIHEGYAARRMEQRGEVSERCEYNRQVVKENAERLEIKSELEKSQAELLQLDKKEREIHERLGRVDGRRKNDELVGRTPEGERGFTATPAPSAPAPEHGAVAENDTPTRTKDYTAELIAFRRAESEREIARISKEREEAKRRQQELARENSKSRVATQTKEHTATKVLDRGFELGR